MESPPECLEVVDSFQMVKDASLEQKLGQVADEHETLPQHLKRLFLYCSLFPFGYEFSKDELVQLWIAEGFIRERQRERMEDTAGEHFNSLENEGFFVFSRCDFTMDFDSLLSAPADNPSNFLYKVNPSKHSLLDHTMFSGTYFKAVDGKLGGASEMTRHLSLIGEDMDGMDFGMLQNFKHLRTLHMLSCRGSSMKHVPRDLCFTLTFLRTLNLSGTLISELPSSIGNVKSLRHVDASHTPISRLPESIDSLHNLQTIKLRGCIHFVQLPKGTKKLKKLRHIDLDIIRQLDSMPAHLGNLSNLQTLPAFLVGRDDGCRVGELKNLNDLKGSFNISRLENVLSKEEAEEAALIEKKCIHRLELRWSDMFVEHAQQEKILECLQPHSGLKELQLQQYSGSILPTWIGNPSFTDLVVITLYRCRNCKLLPCMGQLPALKSLSIIEVNEVKEINHQFFRKGLADHAFPKLERLEVDIMLSLKQWKDVQVGDLPSLVKLTLDSCPELVTLPALFCLKSLKHLELRCCPKLMALPAGGLPTSLEFFLLLDCLELKTWCLKTEHWSMLCHVPSIWFDHEEIKDLQLTSRTTEILPSSPQFSGDVHRIGEDDGSTAATKEKLLRPISGTRLAMKREFEWSECVQEVLNTTALLGRSVMADNLYSGTKEMLDESDRPALFFTCIDNGLYDLAMKLLRSDRALAKARNAKQETALHILARMPSDFTSQSPGTWSRLINSCWNFSYNRNLKQVNEALQLVQCLWTELLRNDHDDVMRLIKHPSKLLFDATKLGNYEFLAVLINSYPDLIWQLDDKNRSIIHVAVLHRHASIFNLVHEIGSIKDIIATFTDEDESNNILHMAAKLAPPNQLNLVSGAALQMQRELVWFEEVKKIVQPNSIEMKNKKGKTPRELFTSEHKGLLHKGEAWMKDTAKSCMIVAALIATIVFSAAILSVPGGTSDNTGQRNFLKETAFLFFAIADGVALVSSSTSILMFLFILTSRYAEGDFLKSLPLKLMIGLASLFISIASMMVAFSATFYLDCHYGLGWVPNLIFVFAFVPVALFAFLQFPLLSDMFSSTYCSSLLFRPWKYMIE
ncbi:uncharacterized protein LOC133732124 isoform X2 [Rosa rugosa]|uniref:uncharacterized protein LOC133732124 isoform X2 n=1 Tax=Rosa rugosa TaxID=74645 RepID=UPI002B406BA9|nr:uncharacterized protein LOC133732124 isoform X2 [Rosa rugosa]